MAQPEKRELNPIYVKDPYTGQAVNVAPILYVAHQYFFGIDKVVTALTETIEDLTCYPEVLEAGGRTFANHMFELKMLRRAFSSVLTGEFPEC